MAASNPSFSGVYEIGVGVSDLEAALPFWQGLGYRAGIRGRLDKAAAKALYGVPSGLLSLRLEHLDARSGLVRLMQWDKPQGPGLNMAPLRTPGCRWSVHRTDDMANAQVHAAAWQAKGKPIHLDGPHYNLNFRQPVGEKQPFEAPVPASVDMVMFLPEAQVVAMSRLNFDMPHYGTINAESPLRMSEACHVGLVVHGGDLSQFDFYGDVLPFTRGTEVSVPHQPGRMASDMFALEEGESFSEVDFDPPGAGADPASHRPGRLRCFVVQTDQPEADRRVDSQPGKLGHSLYTLQVPDIDALHTRVSASVATDVSPVLPDEFGHPAFRFTAPDGFVWMACS